MYEIIEQLVNTRINGNSIKGNKTYENMLKRVTMADIQRYAYDFDILCYGLSKIDCIENIRNSLECNK